VWLEGRGRRLIVPVHTLILESHRDGDAGPVHETPQRQRGHHARRADPHGWSNRADQEAQAHANKEKDDARRYVHGRRAPGMPRETETSRQPKNAGGKESPHVPVRERIREKPRPRHHARAAVRVGDDRLHSEERADRGPQRDVPDDSNNATHALGGAIAVLSRKERCGHALMYWPRSPTPS